MKRVSVIFVISAFGAWAHASMTDESKKFTDLPTSQTAGISSQFKERMSRLDAYSKLPPEERVMKLTYTLGASGSIPDVEAAAYFLRAQEMVLEVPDYAEIFRKYIEETIRLHAAGESATSRTGDEKIIQTLGNLPTPQSVELLGEYLNDTRDHIMMRGDELGGAYKPYLDRGRSQYASFALSAMGIQNPPIHRTSSTYEARLEEIEAWKLWYEQVKNGTRKFKFVGSDVEYSLKDRPSAQTREPRDPRQKAKANSKGASLDHGKGKEERPLVWPWIGALIAAVVTGVLWVCRKKRASRHSS